MAPTRADIINIARRCIDTYDEKLVKRLDAQDLTLANQNEVLQEHSLKLERIDNKISEIYGNGSGRKGILDKMQDTQVVQSTAISDIQSAILSEKHAQELFRAEVRSQSSAASIKDHTTNKINSKWMKRIKYLITPAYIALWELLKHLITKSPGK